MVCAPPWIFTNEIRPLELLSRHPYIPTALYVIDTAGFVLSMIFHRLACSFGFHSEKLTGRGDASHFPGSRLPASCGLAQTLGSLFPHGFDRVEWPLVDMSHGLTYCEKSTVIARPKWSAICVPRHPSTSSLLMTPNDIGYRHLFLLTLIIPRPRILYTPA